MNTADPELCAGSSKPRIAYHYAVGTHWKQVSPELGYAVLSLVKYYGHLYAGTISTSDPRGDVGSGEHKAIACF